MESSARRHPDLLTPRQIFERLDHYVIGQHEAKRAVAIAAYNHLKRIEARKLRRQSLLKKSNVLLIGPTGSGKTHVARNLAQILSVPFTVVDATEFTEAGYYGKDVEAMVADLLLKANHVVEDAERGIIFIDEVDKIARRTQSAKNGAGSRDIGGEGVQQALLKMLEGRPIYCPMNVTQHWSQHDFVQVDTTDILFVCAGTFSDLLGPADDSGRAIGFGATGKRAPQRKLETKDLVDYGMLAEFLGRLPVVVQLEALSEADLVRVLTDPPDAITREYRELLALDDIQIDFAESGLREIVRYSVERGLGARGLRSIMEKVMRDVMFEAPEGRRRKLSVDASFVRRHLSEPTPELTA
jgi:ATP-dependent Clp protease ATP-binding subunit ClpX